MAARVNIPIPKGRRLVVSLILGGLWVVLVVYLVRVMLWPVAKQSFAELPWSGDLMLIAVTVLGILAAVGRIVPPILRNSKRK